MQVYSHAVACEPTFADTVCEHIRNTAFIHIQEVKLDQNLIHVEISYTYYGLFLCLLVERPFVKLESC